MQDVTTVFPELDRIDDPDVRAGVRESWEVARDIRLRAERRD